ncbi:MAG: hypothetical protein AAF654_00460 [Myxococcota bacterium]
MKLSRARAPEIVIGLAAVLLIVFIFANHRLGHNVNSRFITVERLISSGTLVHDDTPLTLSIDSVEVDGKRYSSKPLLYPLVLTVSALPLAAVLGTDVAKHQVGFMRWILLLNQALPWVFLLIVALRWVREKTQDVWVQSVFVAGLSFAILPYGYAATLNNHTPTAIWLFFAWWAVDRILTGGTEWPAAWAFAAGCFGGLAASYELTSGIFFVLFALVLARRNLGWGALVGVGATLGILPVFIGYWWISGEPVPFYLRPELYDYDGSYWRNPQDMDALQDPRWLYVFNSTFGHRGFFAHSPYLLLGLAGIVAYVKRRDWLWSAVLTGSLIVMGYIWYKTDNYGGACISMRWFVQFSPLWAVAALPVLERASVSQGRRVAVIAVILLSLATVWEALNTSAFGRGGWMHWLMRSLELI